MPRSSRGWCFCNSVPDYFFFFAGASGAFFTVSARVPARPEPLDVAPCTTGGLAFLGFLSLAMNPLGGSLLHLDLDPAQSMGAIRGRLRDFFHAWIRLRAKWLYRSE